MAFVKKRVRVQTKDGKAIEGILLHKRPEIVLELADLITETEGGDIKTVQLEGVIRILRDNVSFYQVVVAGAKR